MTHREAILEASQRIDPRDANVLLAHLAGHDHAWLLAHGDDGLAPQTLETFRALVTRRASKEPLQYLTRTQEFYGLNFRVTPAVLIPRPETEHLVEAVLLWAAQQEEDVLRIADVGTGSGAIAIALATHLASAEILAIDTSEAALAVAHANAHTHQCLDRVIFEHGDLLTAVAAHSLNAVVSNPPYISATDAPTMQTEVVAHEPHSALFAGVDGLDIYRRLIPQARQTLKPGGLLAMEFGFGQQEALATLLSDWQNVHFLNDYAGIPRVALATR